MTTAVRRISFRVLGATSEVHLRYLEEDADLRPFLGTRPRSPDQLLQAAPVHARRLVASDVLARALVEYAERHGASAAALDNAAALADAGPCAVVTGQQPGLFGGPLYSLHKAATAIRLSHLLAARPGAPRVVPIFWNHSDDHDIDEASCAFVVNANLDLQRVRLDIPRSGAPLRDIPAARAIEQALPGLTDLLPLTEFRDWALGAITPKSPDDTLGSVMARLLFTVFGEHGLVVIEPRDLPAPAFDVLPRWCEAADGIRNNVRASSEHLADLGLDITVDPTATLMFQNTGQRRLPIADGDPLPRPTALSPGVLLRSLWQDATLPTIASVVGPGELSYLALAGPLYRQFGVPAPVFVPRASLTLVEPSLKKLLDRFGWDLPELAKGPTHLAQALNVGDESPVEDAIDELAENVKRRLAELNARVAKLDAQMAGPVERTRLKIVDDLVKLASRLRRSRQNREGTGLRQIRRLCSNLRPRGRLQERVLTPMPFLVGHGRALADDLVAAADPFALEHGVIEL